LGTRARLLASGGNHGRREAYAPGSTAIGTVLPLIPHLLTCAGVENQFTVSADEQAI